MIKTKKKKRQDLDIYVLTSYCRCFWEDNEKGSEKRTDNLVRKAEVCMRAVYFARFHLVKVQPISENACVQQCIQK